jgi:hypothetical protein
MRRQRERAWLLGPSSSPKFYDYLDSFEPAVFADNAKRLSDFLIWFQAEKTVPNPVMLANDAQMDAEQPSRKSLTGAQVTCLGCRPEIAP